MHHGASHHIDATRLRCAIAYVKMPAARKVCQSGLGGEKHRNNQGDDLENPFHRLGGSMVKFPHAICDLRHRDWRKSGIMVYKSNMGRLSKVVLLSLLLILAGVPGTASLLCVQPMKSHAHACCMGHEQVNASHSAEASVLSGSHFCCKMAPIDSGPAQNLLVSSSSNDGAVVLHAISDIVGDLPALILVSGRGSPRLAKLQHSPVHALLCTFLV